MNPGTHNFFNKLNGVRNASGHIIKQYGSTVPTDATAGYAVGCEFHHTDGSGIDDMLYINVGTTASCNFDSVTSVTDGNIVAADLASAVQDILPTLSVLVATDLESSNTGTVTGSVRDAAGNALAGLHLMTAWTSATAGAVPAAVTGFGITSGKGLEMVELLAEGVYLVQTKSDGTFGFDVALSAPGSTFVNVALGVAKASIECAVTAGE